MKLNYIYLLFLKIIINFVKRIKVRKQLIVKDKY